MSSLTTTQLAERTGVSAGTLRAWQARHGFPVAPGDGGRRHRFGEADVRAVEEVVRLRAEGVSMEAAVARARAAEAELPPSIYAGLRRLRPGLRPQVMQKRALLELTRAIEDEHAARAGSGLLIGSFQTAAHYRAGEARWRELARALQYSAAIADFPRFRSRRGAPLEVPIQAGDPLAREWTLIVNSPGAMACLASWEIPDPRPAPDAERRFEFVWSSDPATVADATRVAAALVRRLAPQAAVPERLTSAVGLQDPSFPADLATRAVTYMGARLERVGVG